RIDARNGTLELMVSNDELANREYADPDLKSHRYGIGRQIFAALRKDLLGAEEGASSIFTYVQESCRVVFPED
ncbi:MAG: hypothetical protein GQ542_10005, partial [Desulforhopalus sp.]|nr:hypothetical protein [Desulforhopalus sp.]